MSERELLKELKKRMLKYGYCDTWTHLKVLINEYEDLTKNEKPIKLKQVIKCIKKLDDNLKFDWTYKLLQELGSDFGSKMFHEAYQQGRFDEGIEAYYKPQKVTIPQFVADWIETAKTVYSFVGGMVHGGPVVNKWLDSEDNQRTFALAWLDGYEVEKEKEKRYVVKIIGITNYNSYLNYHKGENKWTIESRVEIDAIRTKHTRKELEDAGFAWVLDCDGIELEEVTE